MEKKNKPLVALILAVSVLSAACSSAKPLDSAPSSVQSQALDISKAAFVGSQTCISCHGQTIMDSFNKTAHAALFKGVASYPGLNLNQTITIFDDGNKTKPVKINLNPAQREIKGVMANQHLVALLSQKTGFASDRLGLYRIADLEKEGGSWKLTPAVEKDYDKDGTKDWGARNFGDCAICHSPGLAAQAVQAPGAGKLSAGMSCETCHGPGSVHAATGSPAAIAVNEDSCYICHAGGEKPANLTPEQSCLECHNPHGNAQGLLFKQDNLSCESCHESGDSDPHHAVLKTH